jgi:hypothetical protein
VKGEDRWEAHYQSAFIDRALDHYEGNISVTSIYDIDQLEAMCVTARYLGVRL